MEFKESSYKYYRKKWGPHGDRGVSLNRDILSLINQNILVKSHNMSRFSILFCALCSLQLEAGHEAEPKNFGHLGHYVQCINFNESYES